MTRYAIYYAPEPGSPLHAFGGAWLEGHPAGDYALRTLLSGGITRERLREITAGPRGYGFHATLKPPFALASGRTFDELSAAFARFAEACIPFEVAGLHLADIGGFLALTMREPSEPFAQLAERAVRAFEPFRAAPSAEELARRRHAGLNARERELLDGWGYPYVLDAWRFHMTLTQRLDDDERAVVRDALEPLVARFARVPLRIDAVSMFTQTSAAFAETARASFASTLLTEVRSGR
jgi:hypothetical protein